MHIYSFEKMEVWKEAIQIAAKTYQTIKNFPTDEKFGFTSQMRPCPVSVSSNIAEGTARLTSKVKAHYMTMAYNKRTSEPIITSPRTGFDNTRGHFIH